MNTYMYILRINEINTLKIYEAELSEISLVMFEVEMGQHTNLIELKTNAFFIFHNEQIMIRIFNVFEKE